MTILRKLALAIVAAMTIWSAIPNDASAAPLGGLSQAAPALQGTAATKAEPVYYYRRYGYRSYYRPRYYGYYRPYYRVHRYYWRY